jgi:hypothetical protein
VPFVKYLEEGKVYVKIFVYKIRTSFLYVVLVEAVPAPINTHVGELEKRKEI